MCTDNWAPVVQALAAAIPLLATALAARIVRSVTHLHTLVSEQLAEANGRSHGHAPLDRERDGAGD